MGRAVVRLARWAEPGDNLSGVVYGTIAVGAVLAAEAPRRETFASTLEATLVTMALYWFAHTYAALVGRRIDAEERLSVARVRWALGHEWAIVRGAMVPVLVLVVSTLGGFGLTTSVNAALWASAVSLAAWESVAAVRGGGSLARRAGEAAVGFSFGAGLLLLHQLLH